jgi:hypothetical protein
VTVRLAAELGFSAVGVDGCAEFLETARAKAGEFGVGSRCQFVLGDLREYVKKACDFDVAILAYVGDVLGGPRETVGRLRTCVRDGGYILIDDGYLRSGRVFHHYRPHDETVTELLSFGDVLLKEIENTDDEIMEINRSYLRDIRERARGLAARRPGLGPLLKAYLKSQEEECALLTRHFRGATWLVRKGGGKNSKRMA